MSQLNDIRKEFNDRRKKRDEHRKIRQLLKSDDFELM